MDEQGEKSQADGWCNLLHLDAVHKLDKDSPEAPITYCEERILLCANLLIDGLQNLTSNAESSVINVEHGHQDSHWSSVVDYLKSVKEFIENVRDKISHLTVDTLIKLRGSIEIAEAFRQRHGLSDSALKSNERSDTDDLVALTQFKSEDNEILKETESYVEQVEYETVEETDTDTTEEIKIKTECEIIGESGIQEQDQTGEFERDSDKTTKKRAVKSKRKNVTGASGQPLAEGKPTRKRYMTKNRLGPISYVCLEEEYEEDFKCKICAVELKSLKSLSRHIRTRHKNIHLFKCKDCSETFRTKVIYDRHLQKFHPQSKELCCQHCDQVFTSLALVSSHIRTIHKNKKLTKKNGVFTCEICLFTYTTKNHYTSHLYKKHPELVVDKRLKCKVCDVLLANRRYLEMHYDSKGHVKKSLAIMLGRTPTNEDVRGYMLEGKIDQSSIHEQNKSLLKLKHHICDICGVSFQFGSSLRKHMFRHSNQSATCEECGLTFRGKSELKTHSLKHEKKLSFSCNECPKTFVSPGLLNAHHRRVHLNLLPTSYPCTLCHRKFQTKRLQEDHIKYFHENVKRPEAFQCFACEQTFSTKASWQSHEARHTRQSKYNCTLCSRVCVCASELRTHMNRKHLNVKNYLCTHCGKRFSGKGTLKHHEQAVHDNVRRYKCTLCDKAYFRQQAYQEHMWGHSGLKPYKCEQCPKTFRTSGNFATHKKVHARRDGIERRKADHKVVQIEKPNE